MELSTDAAEKANILDTQAEIAAARGDLDRILKLMHQAQQLNPRPYFEEQIERFEGN